MKNEINFNIYFFDIESTQIMIVLKASIIVGDIYQYKPIKTQISLFNSKKVRIEIDKNKIIFHV